MRFAPKQPESNHLIPLVWYLSVALVLPAGPPAARAADVTVGGCARPEAEVAAKRVRVLDSNAPIPLGARVMGVLTKEAAGPSGLRQPTTEYWADKFRAPAGKLGADALAGLRWVHFPGEGRYFATALAVAAAGPGAGAAAPCERLIALDSIRITVDAPPALIEHDREAIAIAAGYSLGRRGYFLMPAISAAPQDSGVPPQAATLAPASSRLTIEVSPAGDRAAGQGGPVRLRAALVALDGREFWTGSAVEEFQDLADIAGVMLFRSRKSRSGRLLAAVERLLTSLPDAPASPVAGDRAP
jgi:hypothetical protein